MLQHYPHLEETKYFFLLILFKRAVWKVEINYVPSSVVWRLENREQGGRASSRAQPSLLASSFTHLLMWPPAQHSAGKPCCSLQCSPRAAWFEKLPTTQDAFRWKGTKKLFLGGGFSLTCINGKRQKLTRKKLLSSLVWRGRCGKKGSWLLSSTLMGLGVPLFSRSFMGLQS